MGNKKPYTINFSGAYEEDGSLVYLESVKDVPFEIKRIFYIFGVPNNMTRASHASVNSDFALIAINGSVTVTLSDGVSSNRYELKDRNNGLYVPSMTWMITSNFSRGSVLLVLANTSFDECYIKDYNEFCKERLTK